MEHLIEKLQLARYKLKDFNKFKHLFSKDDAEKDLAKLNELLGQILLKVKLSSIKKISHPKEKAHRQPHQSQGGLVKVRPCGEVYENKTYIGFHIGDIALSSSISIEEDAINCSWSFYNPAIYIPETNTVVFGAESWWGPIKSIEELEKITDEDIENVWYVKLLKSQLESKPGQES